jgi:hypothetical protein
MLERESAQCRFIGENLINITDQKELETIEEAIGRIDKYSNASAHFKKTAKHLSDNKKPDYANLMKESILAVEATCKVVADDAKATLADALKVISKENEMHPSLRDSFLKLYGYTNDADGIRHARTGDSNINYDDAKFMLVSCSAFSNYLICKISKGLHSRSKRNTSPVDLRGC